MKVEAEFTNHEGTTQRRRYDTIGDVVDVFEEYRGAHLAKGLGPRPVAHIYHPGHASAFRRIELGPADGIVFVPLTEEKTPPVQYWVDEWPQGPTNLTPIAMIAGVIFGALIGIVLGAAL